MTVHIGDTIGLINKVIFNMKDNRENYWKLSEGKVKSITVNSKGRRVKADHFYTLDAEEVENNTNWMLENDRLTKAFHDYIYGRAEIRFIKGRLKFGDSKNPAPFPSMVVVFGKEPTP